MPYAEEVDDERSNKLAVVWRALDPQVIVVAVERVEGAWSAYIGAVRGYSHVEEFNHVKSHGSKLPEKVARSIFDSYSPFNELPYAL